MDSRLLQLSPDDNVAMAKTDLASGTVLHLADSDATLRHAVPAGHKIAIRPIGRGEKVMKYGLPIGSATCDISPGDNVHTHNLKSDYLPTFARGETTHEGVSGSGS